jgi:GNAT superfamily N-acetyltransferase
MPWLWQPNSPVGQPNGLGPPMLNYAAPPNQAAPTVGQGVAQTAADVAQAWPSVEEQRRMLQPLPGWQGTAVDAAKQWAEGVMMGTTAPGETPGLSPAERFQDAFDAAHARSGLADVSKVHFFEHGPNEVEISHIQVDPDKRGQGIGNTLMGTATELADKHGVTLHASPASDADASAGLDYEGLRDWYQRWGFDQPGGGDRLTRSPSTTAPGDVLPPGIDSVRHAWDALGVDHAMSEGNGTITLSKVVVPPDVRNQGVGSQAMQHLTDYADATGQRIVLSPSKDFGATSMSRLTDFYKGMGFKPNKGRSRDFTTMESMIRDPVQADE